jgi:hypothetical protein
MKRPWDAIAWWELRRIPYNLVIGALGLATILVVDWFDRRFVWAGADPLNPLGFILGIAAYGIAANIFYTLGWITELLWSGGDTSRTELMRRRVFWVGVLFSSGLTLLPAILIPAAWIVFGLLGFHR